MSTSLASYPLPTAPKRSPRTPNHRAKAISLIGVAGLHALESNGLVVVPANRLLALGEIVKMVRDDLSVTAQPKTSASSEEKAEVAS